MNRPVIYVVVAQENTDLEEYTRLYRGSHVVYVYAHKVQVDTGMVKGEYHLFSFQKLPNKILIPDEFDRIRREQQTMIESTLDDDLNEFVIWAFPLDVHYIGIYVSVLHSLEKRGKKLRFHLPPEEVIRIQTDPVFKNLSEKFINLGIIEIPRKLVVKNNGSNNGPFSVHFSI